MVPDLIEPSEEIAAMAAHVCPTLHHVFVILSRPFDSLRSLRAG